MSTIARPAKPKASKRSSITCPITVHAETRSSGELKLSGLAVPYGQRSEWIGFYEEIRPGAFNLAARDLLLLWQHDTKQPLARTSAKNLTVRSTSRGIEFEATLPPTQIAQDAHLLVESRVVAGMSFGFVVTRDSWTQRDGEPLRIVEEADLFELSLVTDAAYGDRTDVSARNLQRRIENQVAAMRARAAATPTPGKRQHPVSVRSRSVYGPGSQHSYFRDKALVEVAEQHGQALRLKGIPGAAQLPFGGATQESLGEARKRLATVERRNVTTSDPGAAGFLPAGDVPAFISDQFAVSARAAAVVAPLLTAAELGPGGTVSVPRFSTGASIEMHLEAGSVSETDIDSETGEAPAGVAAGLVDISQQAVDAAVGGVLDVALAAELGRALGERIDQQVLNGAGTGEEIRGLLAVSGITSASYTDASPTVTELLAALWQLSSTAATAYGQPLPVLLAHARRLAWLESKALTTNPPLTLRLPGSRTVQSTAIPTTNGSSTNEDVMILLDPTQVVLASRPPQLEVFAEAQSDKLMLRFRTYSFFGLAVRQPTAVAALSGTGLSSPTF